MPRRLGMPHQRHMPSAADDDTQPRLSVVVPAYNEANWLSDTLRSIRASRDELASSVGLLAEIIVVDDQSSDGTGEVGADLADQVILGPRTTIGAARNAGAEVARGNTLIFIDADTRVERGVLPAIDMAVADGACAGSVRGTYESDRALVAALLRFWDWYAPRRNITQGVCQFFDRSVFESLGGYRTDLKMAEDTDLYHRAMAVCERSAFATISDVAVYPSMRRYEQVSTARLWLQMNPLTTQFCRRAGWLWRDWYVDPPR
jgi:glycosyltransferase involved in cell wall biosynthesis